MLKKLSRSAVFHCTHPRCTSFLFLSRRHLQRVFEWREKPSSWCIADVVTYSVVCEWWLQSCRFLVLCDVKVHAARSLPPVCFFGVLLLLVGCAHAVTRTFHGVAPRSVLSWIPRRVRSGATDASGAAPPSLRRVQICLVLPVLTNPAFRGRLRL